MQVNHKIVARVFLKLFLLIVLFLTIILSLFIYKNSLYFILSLLLVCLRILIFLSLHSYLRFLTVFILVIVYVGAIIVLIGYICAIRPNLTLEPDYQNFFLYLFLILFFSLFSYNSYSILEISTVRMVDYFYRFQGIFMFLTLVLILFVTLLIVTSQYSVPKGPFRSIRL
jgi:hypothetical protein